MSVFNKLLPLHQALGESTEKAANVLSLGALIGWILGALPTVSLLITALWGALKCYEVVQTIKLNSLEKTIKEQELRNLKVGNQ